MWILPKPSKVNYCALGVFDKVDAVILSSFMKLGQGSRIC